MGVQQFILYTKLLKNPKFVTTRAEEYVGMLKQLKEDNNGPDKYLILLSKI